MSAFLLWWLAEDLPLPKMLSPRGKGSAKATGPTSPCSVSCVGVVFSNRALPSVYGEQLIVFETA